MKKILFIFVTLFATLSASAQMNYFWYNNNDWYGNGAEVEVRKANSYIYGGQTYTNYTSDFYSINGFTMPYAPFTNIKEYATGVHVDLVNKKVTIPLDNGEELTLSNNVDSLLFYNKYSDARILTDCCYLGLYRQTENPNTSFYMYSQLASDDCLGGGGAGDLLVTALDYMMNYGSIQYDGFYYYGWYDIYHAIEFCNTALAHIDDATLGYTTKEELNDMKGEVYFLRAYYYYLLASMYGNIPVYTDNDAIVDKNIQKSPAEAWGRILLDLKTAVSLMANGRKADVGTRAELYPSRVDKYTAEAMIARAWLFYTGMYCNGDKLDEMTDTDYKPLVSVELPDGTTMKKTDVIDYLNDVINNSGASLVPDFRNLWAYTNRCTVEDYDYTRGKGLKWVEDDYDVNPEALFAIKYNTQASWSSTTGFSNLFDLYQGMRCNNYGYDTFPFGAGWGYGSIAPNLVDDWAAAEPNDTRREASIQNVNELSGYQFGAISDAVQETEYYNKKTSPIETLTHDYMGYGATFESVMYSGLNWRDAEGNFMQLGNIHNLVLIRYADVLLMQSELTENADYMNQVRARAGLSPVAYSLKALQNERRWEFAGEYLRWNDIRRWHIAADALAKQAGVNVYNEGNLSANKQSGGGYAMRYNQTAGFYMIPQQAIINSSFQIKQNPGWTDGTSFSNYTGYGNDGTTQTWFDNKEDYDRYVFVQDSTRQAKAERDSTVLADTPKDIFGRSDNSMKRWYLNVDGNGCWGNATRTGNGALYSATEVDGKISGVATTNDLLNSFISYAAGDESLAKRDAQQGSYVIFDKEGYITSYTSDGTQIRRACFDFIDYDASRKSGWQLATLKTWTANGKEKDPSSAILWPYSYEGNGAKQSEFYLMYLDYDNMTLVSTNASGEITYWRFTTTLPHSFLAGNGTKKWVWNEDGKYCWGNAGNTGNGSAFTATNVDGQWWGVANSEDLIADYDGTSLLDVHSITDDKAILYAQKGSYMLFGSDGTLQTYTSEGVLISSATYSMDDYDPSRSTGWQVATLHTSSPAILWPYCTGDGQQVSDFDVMYIDDNYMTLVNTKKSTPGDWGETTYWRFKNATPSKSVLEGSEGRKWYWNTDGNGCWGNAGNAGMGYLWTATEIDGKWWGVNSADELLAYLNNAGDVDYGDADNNAYMEFKDGKVSTYKADGSLIRSSNYTVDIYEEGRDINWWELGKLYTDAPALLFPWSINEGGKAVTEFDIMYMDADCMVLANTKGNPQGSWGEITWWRFAAK